MKRIDAHIHYAGDAAEDVEMLARHDLKLLNISVAVDTHGGWRQRTAKWQKVAQMDSSRYAWVTSFDLPRFDDADYIDAVIAGLESDFEAGATACKVWKNIGMEVKKPSGEFMMIDDPFFDPIFEYLEKRDATLLMHIGEPLACWQPLVDDNPHFGYYSKNPQWHMHGRTDYPHHTDIIAARDRMVAKFPDLRIVGAHLASLEYDVAQIARRFDELPNFAVDTSARMLDLTYQDSSTVREFIDKYRDRVLFGTDMVCNDLSSELSEEDRRERIARTEERFLMEFSYYESADAVDIRGRKVQGLGLSGDVLENFYHRNAERWYPGL